MKNNEYTIFNTCSTKLSKNTLSNLELLVWYCSIISYKNNGYKLKLYCRNEDINYLKKEFLYDLYDEIDCTTLSSSENKAIISKINMKKFWSTLKLLAIDHELNINSKSIYSDTDIISFKPYDIKQDTTLLVWGEEKIDKIYDKFKDLSVPDGYIRKQFIEDTKSAFNCGVLYFKYIDFFKEYFKEYLDFTKNNPCIMSKENTKNDIFNNFFACNAEQKILKAIYDKNKEQCVQKIEEKENTCGIVSNAFHLYRFKILWARNDFLPVETEEQRAIKKNNILFLNIFINQCFNFLKENNFYYLYEHLKNNKKYFEKDYIEYYG